MEEDDGPGTAIMLAEDKKYYPSAEEVSTRDANVINCQAHAQFDKHVCTSSVLRC